MVQKITCIDSQKGLEVFNLCPDEDIQLQQNLEEVHFWTFKTNEHRL